MAKRKKIDPSDSDIICNGGYPFTNTKKVAQPPAGPCGGLMIDRPNEDYTYDSPQRLYVTGHSVKALRYPSTPVPVPVPFDLSGKNWHIFIYPHLVILHTRDQGNSVEIKCPDGFKAGVPNHPYARQHPDHREIESMILVVGTNCYFMSGCKFTLEYR